MLASNIYPNQSYVGVGKLPTVGSIVQLTTNSPLETIIKNARESNLKKSTKEGGEING
jgi:hypothetical protein